VSDRRRLLRLILRHTKNPRIREAARRLRLEVRQAEQRFRRRQEEKGRGLALFGLTLYLVFVISSAQKCLWCGETEYVEVLLPSATSDSTGRARGFSRAITYTLKEEAADTLKAAGWHYDGETKGGTWNRPSRARVDKAPTGKKTRWRRDLS